MSKQKPPGPAPKTQLTDDMVKDWLYRASVRDLNIFDDKNEIIVHLCRSLLVAWKALGQQGDPPSKT